MQKRNKKKQVNTCIPHMFWIRRAAPTEPTAVVSIYIVWCVMSAGISRQQMVTLCLLNFSTTHSNRLTHTHTHIHSHRPQLIRTSTAQREKKQIPTLSIPTSHMTKAGIVHHLHAQTHNHINTQAQWQKPVCIKRDISPVSCRWERNCGWQIDWKIILPPSSIISACLSSAFCSIYLLGKKKKTI